MASARGCARAPCRARRAGSQRSALWKRPRQDARHSDASTRRSTASSRSCRRAKASPFMAGAPSVPHQRPRDGLGQRADAGGAGLEPPHGIAVVEAHATAWPGSTFKGRVVALLPEVDPQTRTLTARVVDRQRGDRLVPGMFVTLDFAGQPERAAARRAERSGDRDRRAQGRHRRARAAAASMSRSEDRRRRGRQDRDPVGARRRASRSCCRASS